MKRNQLTTAAALSPGDVFYKLKDKAKRPLQMVEHKATSTHYQTYNYWCAPNGNIKLAEAIKGNTQVVFLRRLNLNGN